MLLLCLYILDVQSRDSYGLAHHEKSPSDNRLIDFITPKDEEPSKKSKSIRTASFCVNTVNSSVRNFDEVASVTDELPRICVPNMFNQNQLNPSQYPKSMLQSNLMQLMATRHPNTAMNYFYDDGMNSHINNTTSENFVPSMWLPVSYLQQFGTGYYLS